MEAHQVLLQPIITEKTTFEGEAGRYTFQVASGANKHQIKEAVEELFDVEVVRVNVRTMPGKKRRFGRWVGRPSPWKKASVTLAEGQSIEFFEGV